MKTPSEIERQIRRLQCYIRDVRQGLIPGTPSAIPEIYREIARLRELERKQTQEEPQCFT
jgi:hypothetical protein